MKTLLERFIAQLNANVFFSEFTFATTEFAGENGEYELADHLVVVDDLGLAFQLKERGLGEADDGDSLARWFERKVKKKAVRQMRQTRQFLRERQGVELLNQRGRRVAITVGAPERFPGLVLFRAPTNPEFKPPKFYNSKSAGFIHFIPDTDYFNICRFLLTPTEVIDYLAFRQDASSALQLSPHPVSEAALAGQFVEGDFRAVPNQAFARRLQELQQNREEWDLSFITERLGDQITERPEEDDGTSHYRILAELAKLTRVELKAFKERLRLSIEAAKEDRFERPYRFAVPRTDCGFMLLPIQREFHGSIRTALENLSRASKYDFKTRRHIGAAIRIDGQHVDILWSYTTGEHRQVDEVDAMLANSYPFRRTSDKVLPRYRFGS